MIDAETRADLAARAADAGAQVALAAFRSDLAVETKTAKTDVVTQTDRDAQRRVIEIIHGECDEPVVGEEADVRKELPEGGPAWIVDPIDGTNNFVRGLRIWGTSVASVVDGEPIAAATVLPALADTYRTDGERVTLNGDPVSVSDREDVDTFVIDPILLDDAASTAGTDALAERLGDYRRLGAGDARGGRRRVARRRDRHRSAASLGYDRGRAHDPHRRRHRDRSRR